MAKSAIPYLLFDKEGLNKGRYLSLELTSDKSYWLCCLSAPMGASRCSSFLGQLKPGSMKKLAMHISSN